MFRTTNRARRKFLFSLLILIVLYTICKQFRLKSTESASRNRDSLRFPIQFYKDVFIDFRFSPPKLRVFSINPCLQKNETFFAAELFLPESTSPVHLKLNGTSLETSCPWSWAPTCHYATHTFTASLANLTISELKSVGKVIIRVENRTIPMNVRSVDLFRKRGFTVCVQPVYWYSQFQNIVFFVESWLAQGADSFIVYFHSSTKEVRLVLEYYQQMGILTIKPWPRFGRLPSKFPDMNAQVYRLGHTLAQNLCILEIETEFGAIVDFDELIVPPKGTLFQFARAQMSGTRVAALYFKHTSIQLELNAEKTLFDSKSIKNPVFRNKTGPSKMVFYTSSIALVLTHSIREFVSQDEEIYEKPSKGALLHFRFNSGMSDLRPENGSFPLFPSDFEGHLKRMKTVMETVFGNSLPVYRESIIVVLNECIEDIKEANECRSTVTHCRRRMESLGEWHFDETSDVFVF